jgi:mannose-1-phosphate guanylyltransferase
MAEIHAVILAGGSGTRFWPASRRMRPKQLLGVGPDPNTSLLAATVRRLSPICSPERTWIATGEHLVAATREALPQLPPRAFLGEPVARNTAACIGWAAMTIHRQDPDAVVMVLPSDHHVGNEAEFLRVIAVALGSATNGPITTVGIRPTRPETGYGYLEVGAEVAAGVHRVTRFVEKPDAARAAAYLESGRYLWNSGMFFFRAATLLDAIAQHLPALAAGLREIDAAVGRDPDPTKTLREVFASLPSVSIDHGVMEHQSLLHVVPGAFDWSDLGSWESAWELGQKDAAGNVLVGRATVLDGHNNLVQDLRTDGRRRVVVAVGVQDLCIVDTEDALLILPRDRAQDVRLAVEHLRAGGDDDLL